MTVTNSLIGIALIAGSIGFARPAFADAGTHAPGAPDAAPLLEDWEAYREM